MLSSYEFLKKYNIEDFYVGELYITEDNKKQYEEIKQEHMLKSQKQMKLIVNGAISLQTSNYQIDDNIFNSTVSYYKVLTLFRKTEYGYLCLHDDNNLYGVDNEDFVSNLVRLDKLLPKIGYKIPHKINDSKALFMFEQLFNSFILLDNIYNDAKYSVDNFYLGTLILNTEILMNGMKNRSKQVNVTSKSILEKGARIICLSSKSFKNESFSLEKNESDKYKFIHYECLFLKTKMGLYNVNDFQIYNNDKCLEHKIDNSVVENIRPITDTISGIKESRISIPKVLKKIRNKEF